MRSRLALGVAVVGVVLLGACGGDGDDEGAGGERAGSEAGGGSDTDSYIEAKTADLSDEQDGLGLDEPGATCFAAAIVDVVGRDRLVEAGITPDDFAADSLSELEVDLPDSAAADLSAGVEECDLVEQLEDVAAETFLSELGTDLPPTASTCMADGMDDQAFADAAAATFVDASDPAIPELLFTALQDCPEISTAALLAQTPNLTPQGEACVVAFVDANRAVVAEGLTSGSEAPDELATQLATACPESQS